MGTSRRRSQSSELGNVSTAPHTEMPEMDLETDANLVVDGRDQRPRTPMSLRSVRPPTTRREERPVVEMDVKRPVDSCKDSTGAPRRCSLRIQMKRNEQTQDGTLTTGSNEQSTQSTNQDQSYPGNTLVPLLNSSSATTPQEELSSCDEEEEKKEDDLDGTRRSRRDRNRIRLKGTAPTFYRRLGTLFFSKTAGYKSMCSRKLQLQRVCSNPPIYVIDDFLTASELEYFHEKISSIRFEKSFVDNMEYGNSSSESNRSTTNVEPSSNKRQPSTIIDTSHRTSTFFAFRKLHDSKISALESRIADFLGCWVHQIEALQLVRYMPGQFFGCHHDMGDLLDDDQVALPKKNIALKRRLVTLFCYLNTLEEDQGGCTYFPDCNLRVRPLKGRAVLWSNVTSEGLPDPRTIHAGEPVSPPKRSTKKRKCKRTVPPSKNEPVVKFGLNIWICEE